MIVLNTRTHLRLFNIRGQYETISEHPAKLTSTHQPSTMPVQELTPESFSRFQMSYRKKEIPKYQKKESELMDKLGLQNRKDVHLMGIDALHELVFYGSTLKQILI